MKNSLTPSRLRRLLGNWVVGILASFALAQSAFAAITLKETNWNTDGTMPTIDAHFYVAQQAGDFNVVIIGWNDTTSTVVSVTDTMGNTYVRAVGPTIHAGNVTQSIYYAKNVAATAVPNQVVVTFDNASVPSADLRIAQYSGIDTVNPLDGAVGSFGDGTAFSSGSVTTTNANDLLVTGDYIEFATTSTGSGFTQREFTDLNHIYADKIVSSTGVYSATATQDNSGYWVMQMAAFKAAAGGGDIQAPSVPSGLTTTLINSTQINLSWTASTDNVGVTGYEVQRCQGSQCTSWASVGTPSSNSFNNTDLIPSTTYRFQVRARDAVPNWSAYSAIFNVTTSAASDTQAPSVPTGLATTLITSTQIDLSWIASTDNVAVTGYEVQRCQGAGCTSWATVGTPASTSFNNTGLSPSTTYRFQIRARDAIPNWSAYSAIFNVTTSAAPDTQAPSVPTGLTTTLVNSTQINASWTASTDNVGVTGYEVQRCQGVGCTSWATVGTPTSTSLNNTSLSPSTTYRFQVRARDAVPNWSGFTTILTVVTQSVAAPPTSPVVTAMSDKEIDIAWTASVTQGVTGYIVERCQGASCSNFAQLGSTVTATYLYDASLTASTSYSYRIRSVDSSGGQSVPSSTLTILTLATQACD